MLKIRPEQMEVLSEYVERQFEGKIINFLQKKFADAKRKSVEQLRPFVHEQVEKSRSYRLVTEWQISVYVTVAWLLGREFDTHFPETSEELKKFHCTADEKSKWLAEWAQEKLTMLRARRTSNLNAWKETL
jgi:hypothetical protein